MRVVIWRAINNWQKPITGFRQELDAQQALVSRNLEGTIKADEANVASAQLQLDWSRITAPVSGRVGLKTGGCRQPDFQQRYRRYCRHYANAPD